MAVNNRIYVEICDGGFIVETYVGALGTHKRVHADVEKAADDVRARLRAHAATTQPITEPRD